MSTGSSGKGAAKAAPTLDELAAQIREETEAVDEMEEIALARAIRIGRLLRQAKTQVSYGDWKPWLKKNYSGGDSTARRWMQLAAPENRSRTSDCKSVAEALTAIRKPKAVAASPKRKREAGKRLRALHALKREKDSNLLIARVDIMKMVGILEGVDLPGLGFGDADDETVADIHVELSILFDWLDRTLTVATARLSEQQRTEKIRKLREATNGRTPEEIATAHRLADRLERRQLVSV